MDKLGADYWRCVDSLVKRLSARPLVIQLPIGQEAEFRGVVDVVEMKALY